MLLFYHHGIYEWSLPKVVTNLPVNQQKWLECWQLLKLLITGLSYFLLLLSLTDSYSLSTSEQVAKELMDVAVNFQKSGAETFFLEEEACEW